MCEWEWPLKHKLCFIFLTSPWLGQLVKWMATHCSRMAWGVGSQCSLLSPPWGPVPSSVTMTWLGREGLYSCTRGCSQENSALGEEPGAPLLPPHGPLPLMKSAHSNACHYHSPAPHQATSLQLCHFPASTSFLPAALQTYVRCNGGWLHGNGVPFSPNSMTTVIIILAAVIALIIGFGISGM